MEHNLSTVGLQLLYCLPKMLEQGYKKAEQGGGYWVKVLATITNTNGIEL